ncbi:ABC transporter ATP-binding protein [uncultured Tistrella sp.]|uniref:ABC transporter ATP-binding protein n=1 Tax=Tistrella mobilis TaxID=171437 RepID=UPI000C09610E|nr:ABC transporter ATP-binding protein [uncultured Tistrella sp.]MAM73193.1 Fe3+/spermidine/putrescine ABC transporter ATP-binding protein [Tistrella sp.]
MAKLTIDRLHKRYGDTEVVRDVSITVADGEFVSLLGPSGCGKTTILRMVAGLIEPSAGRILAGEEDITRLPPHRRRIGLVFQSYALFPHLTVAENVAFGLKRQGVRGAELSSRVKEALALVRLDHLADRYPRQMSGGQQQRVAIARAVAPRPRMMLFDEPLSNLDAQLRDEMQIELKRLQGRLGITSLFVTHDQSEALSLSDRVCVLAHGVIQQFDAPEAIYARPANGFVASFIGRPNRLQGRVETAGPAGRVRIGPDLTLAAADPQVAAGGAAEIIIRQEAIRLLAPEADAPHAVAGEIAFRSFTGARVQYVVKLAGGVEMIAETSSAGPGADLAPGAAVRLAIDPGQVFAMPAGGAA